MSDDRSYEEMVSELEQILERLDDGTTPIDELAADVKRGAHLVKALDSRLRSIETQVRDAFQELDGSASQP